MLDDLREEDKKLVQESSDIGMLDFILKMLKCEKE